MSGDMACKNKCCNTYWWDAEPKTDPKGRDKFTEIHACPTCNSKIQITFQRVDIGGQTRWDPVDAVDVAH